MMPIKEYRRLTHNLAFQCSDLSQTTSKFSIQKEVQIVSVFKELVPVACSVAWNILEVSSFGLVGRNLFGLLASGILM